MDSEVCMDLMILSCQWGGMDRGEINSYFQFFPLERTKQMSLAPQGLDMVSKYQEAGFIQWLVPGYIMHFGGMRLIVIIVTAIITHLILHLNQALLCFI